MPLRRDRPVILPDRNWPSPPPGLALAGDEIHVWRASLDQPAGRHEEMWRVLSADERRRAGRFHFERDRWRFVARRAFLRAILGLYLDQDPAQVQFFYGSHGKPALAVGDDAAGLEFNLAHSGALALYAFACGRAVGVDVEQVHPIADADDVATRFFSAQEKAAYSQLPPGQREMGFFLCWTRKEAYVKALGEGLARPLGSFDVSLAPGEPARLLRAPGWSLISLEPAAGFVGALAVHGQDLPVACWDYR
jgi:4'-phosphopantetheinyl transferase